MLQDITKIPPGDRKKMSREQVPEGAECVKLQLKRSQQKKGKHTYFSEEGEMGTTGTVEMTFLTSTFKNIIMTYSQDTLVYLRFLKHWLYTFRRHKWIRLNQGDASDWVCENPMPREIHYWLQYFPIRIHRNVARLGGQGKD